MSKRGKKYRASREKVDRMKQHTLDEALALPTAKSAMIALRTQQIIAYESGVADTIDLMAGSYAVEAMTEEIEKKVLEYIDKIEEMGGMMAAIEDGYVQKEIQDAAYAYQLAIDRKEQVIVGVNAFQVEEEEEEEREILKIDPAVETGQIERVRDLRQRRDNAKVEEALEEVKRVAKDGGNIMFPILDAVRVYATLGEIAGAMREVFGEYHEKVVL